MNSTGLRAADRDRRRCVTLEPALACVRDKLVGGIFSPGDESGDAHTFAVRLAELCAGLGVDFRWGRGDPTFADRPGGASPAP